MNIVSTLLLFHILPQIYTANHATFQILMYANICQGDFCGTCRSDVQNIAMQLRTLGEKQVRFKNRRNVKFVELRTTLYLEKAFLRRFTPFLMQFSPVSCTPLYLFSLYLHLRFFSLVSNP